MEYYHLNGNFCSISAISLLSYSVGKFCYISINIIPAKFIADTAKSIPDRFGYLSFVTILDFARFLLAFY